MISTSTSSERDPKKKALLIFIEIYIKIDLISVCIYKWTFYRFPGAVLGRQTPLPVFRISLNFPYLKLYIIQIFRWFSRSAILHFVYRLQFESLYFSCVMELSLIISFKQSKTVICTIFYLEVSFVISFGLGLFTLSFSYHPEPFLKLRLFSNGNFLLLV